MPVRKYEGKSKKTHPEDGTRAERHGKRPEQRRSPALQYAVAHGHQRALHPSHPVGSGLSEERVAKVQGVIHGEADGHHKVHHRYDIEADVPCEQNTTSV